MLDRHYSTRVYPLITSDEEMRLNKTQGEAYPSRCICYYSNLAVYYRIYHMALQLPGDVSSSSLVWDNRTCVLITSLAGQECLIKEKTLNSVVSFV